MGRLLWNCIQNASIPLILLLATAFPVFCQNQAPTITSLSPPSAAAGGPGFQLAVYGNNFAQGAIVQWNGSNRVTTESDVDSVLYATILASDIASVGTATVTVVNPGPTGGISNSVAFTILNKNPLPALNNLSPSAAPVGGDGFILTVQGSNFVGSSTIRWNGSDRSTSYISSTSLSAYIPASNIPSVGKAEVTVFTPSPGGGLSGSLSFFITANPKSFHSFS